MGNKLVPNFRTLSGFEMMQIAGCPPDIVHRFITSPLSVADKAASDALAYDLAGNAFSGGVVVAIVISVLLYLDPEKLIAGYSAFDFVFNTVRLGICMSGIVACKLWRVVSTCLHRRLCLLVPCMMVFCSADFEVLAPSFLQFAVRCCCQAQRTAMMSRS
jgi:hypothetical protein